MKFFTIFQLWIGYDNGIITYGSPALGSGLTIYTSLMSSECSVVHYGRIFRHSSSLDMGTFSW